MGQQTITKSFVDKLEPKSVEYTAWDSKLPGFGIRVRPSGAKSFVVLYRAGSGRGVPVRRFTIGSNGKLTPDTARNIAKTVLGAVAQGRDPAAEKSVERTTPTLAELCDRFMKEHVEGKNRAKTTKARYQGLIDKYLKPNLGNVKTNKLTRSAISKLHSSLGARHGVSANRLLSLLGSIYSFAEREALVPEGFRPAKHIPRHKESEREHYLTTDELATLGETLREAETIGLPWQVDETSSAVKHVPKINRLAKIDPFGAAAIRLLIFTGCRLREILTLKWENVDLSRGALFLPTSKTGRKTVILNAPALEILNGLKRLGPYVIPGNDPTTHRVDLKKPWGSIRRHAHLEHVRLHDLRHTYASVGVGGNLGLPIIGKLLGHKSPKTTARYANVPNDPIRRATENIGARLADAMGETRKKNNISELPSAS